MQLVGTAVRVFIITCLGPSQRPFATSPRLVAHGRRHRLLADSFRVSFVHLRCGLVAVVMASRCLSLPARCPADVAVSAVGEGGRRTDGEALALLEYVRQNGFSKQGEMFDASQLAEAMGASYPCSVHVEKDWTPAGAIHHLLAGRLLLVPYDAAPNHEPCLQGGASDADGSCLRWLTWTSKMCSTCD